MERLPIKNNFFKGFQTFYDPAIPANPESSVKVEKDSSQAVFWYTKSAEDRYFGAHLALAEWYKSQYQTHLRETSNLIPPEHEFAQELSEQVKNF